MVFDANPLDDILNTRKIAAVYLARRGARSRRPAGDMAKARRVAMSWLRAGIALLLCLPPAASAQTDIAAMSGAGRDIRKVEIAAGVYPFMTMRDAREARGGQDLP